MPPAVPWTNQDLVLYHGTSLDSAEQIARHGVDIGRGRDFAEGYYCSTNRATAEEWAEKTCLRKQGQLSALVRHSIERDRMANLTTLSFVRGDASAEDFWSLVHYCRGYGLHHARRVPTGLQCYDVVCGPIALWPYISVKNRADQISFHTRNAQDMLNNHSQRSIIELW